MKKIFSLLLTLALAAAILAGCGGSTQPETTELPETKVAFSGSGTAADPYQIASAEDLLKMAELVNGEKFEKTYKEAYYILTADIDLGGKAWTPIGDGYLDSVKSFPGTFDGDGHTISGLNVTASAEEKTRFFGLFGQVEGTVKNLTIVSSTIDCSGKDTNTGAIAGCIYYGATIENCHVAEDVSVTGSYTTGGLAGQMNGTMTNCTNAGSVTGTSEVGVAGGLTGQIAGYKENANDGTVENCANFGAVQSAGDVGGVAGSLLKGSIRNSTNEAAVSGENAGGIVGIINAAQTDGSVSDYVVSECSNSGAIAAIEHAGGIAADASITTGNVSISNCTNSGSVLGQTMGGILSSCSTSTPSAVLTVTGCTNSGTLENREADGTTVSGGIAASLTGKDSGSFVISESKNEASIDAGTGRAGGILDTYTSAMSGEDATVTLDIANCSNEASISGGSMGIGGIVGEVSAANYPAVTLTINSCTNAGDLYGRTANVRIGGIVGVIEPNHCTAVFTNCTNSGNLSCEEVTVTKEEEWFDFSAAMGGILGYAGVNGVSITPEDDCGLGDTTVLTFDGCSNTGTITPANDKIEYYTGDICGLSVVGADIR